jgi:2-polyprenyl-6-methoxyphenol hydroxylase-like FAD-dependent oxidoreductase
VSAPLGDTAVVIGGSVAGSFAARVLHDHFERVVVLDKDALPDGPEPRKGAPQAVHFHALLARGRMVAEELFPGFDDDLVAAGASLRSHSESLVFQPYGWGPRVERDAKNVGASRLLIESVIRRRARALPRVEVRTGSAVTDLLATDDGARVTGVRVQPASGAPYELAADLVVDASGRTSPIETWLGQLGVGVTDTTKVNAHWGYTSRFYDLPDGVAPPVVGGFPIGPASDGPPATRGGFLLLQEHGHWLVTLSGCAKDFPPGDEDGFLDFADSLAFPHIGEAIRCATPRSELQTWRNTINRLRHFDRLPRWPDGLVAMGDAVCSFNPVYGQGMSVASLEALDLRTELDAQHAEHDGFTGLGRRFQARVAQTVQQGWTAACRSDYAVPDVEGDPPPEGFMERFAYLQRVVALGRDDIGVYERISATNQLLLTEDWADEPDVRTRVLEHWDELGARMGRTDPRPAHDGGGE